MAINLFLVNRVSFLIRLPRIFVASVLPHCYVFVRPRSVGAIEYVFCVVAMIGLFFIRLCAFTLIWNVFESSVFVNTPLKSVPFLCVFVGSSANGVTKTDIFLYVFVQNRSSMNGTLNPLLRCYQRKYSSLAVGT